MKATDSLIVELNRVSLLTADGDGGFEVGKDFPAIGSLNNSERQFRHAHLESRLIRFVGVPRPPRNQLEKARTCSLAYLSCSPTHTRMKMADGSILHGLSAIAKTEEIVNRPDQRHTNKEEPQRRCHNPRRIPLGQGWELPK